MEDNKKLLSVAVTDKSRTHARPGKDGSKRKRGGGVELTLLTVLFRLPSIGLMALKGRPSEGSWSDSESESETLLLLMRSGVICYWGGVGRLAANSAGTSKVGRGS